MNERHFIEIGYSLKEAINLSVYSTHDFHEEIMVIFENVLGLNCYRTTLEVEARFIFNYDGTINVLAVSTLEDLYNDYFYFKKQAKIRDEKDELFLYKRYCRTAFITLIAYFEGVINRWVRKLNEKRNETLHLSSKDRRNFCKKVERILSCYNINVSNWDESVFNFIKKLRHQVVHCDFDSELNLFGNISLKRLEKAESLVFDYINEVKDSLAFDAHPSSDEAMKPFYEELIGRDLSDSEKKKS